jgi:hypothetical protein
VTLVYTAKCFVCDWTTEGPASDREAEKHGKATGHSTVTTGRPG